MVHMFVHVCTCTCTCVTIMPMQELTGTVFVDMTTVVRLVVSVVVCVQWGWDPRGDGISVSFIRRRTDLVERRGS